MPFVPLSPEERTRFDAPCGSPEHSPPPAVVIQVRKWVCPACGWTVFLVPTRWQSQVESVYADAVWRAG